MTDKIYPEFRSAEEVGYNRDVVVPSSTLSVAQPIQIHAFNANELVTMPLPQRQYVLRPVLGTKGIMMIHAQRGTGKTFVVLSLAYAIATGGSVFGWTADKAYKVLIVDGEMALEDLRSRITGIAAGSETDLQDPDNIKIIAADYHENGLPDLSTIEGQSLLWPHFEAAEVVIFDNLSTLFTTLKESDNDDSQKATALFLELRRKGKAVMIVHHSGKGGGQRGASRREDTLNTVIALKRPEDCDEQDGCVFNVIFEKARGFHGKDAEPFRAELMTSRDGSMAWRKVELMDANLAKIIELKNEGMTQRDIAKEVALSPATVNRILKKAKES